MDVLAARIEAVAQSAGPGRAEVEAFAAELAERLFGFALAGYLDVHRPVVGHLFTLLGVIEVVPVAATAAAPAHTRRALRLDRLSRLIDDPVAVLTELYGWGSPEFEWDLLLRRLSAFLGRVTDFSFVQPGPPPFLRIAAVDIGLTDDAVPGVQAVLRVQTEADLDLVLPLGETAALTASADAALELGAGAVLLPPADLQVRPLTTEVSGGVRAGFQAPAAPGTAPVVVLGAAGGSRLEGRRVRAAAGADLTWNVLAGRAEGAFAVEAAIEGGRVVLSLEGADGFLTTILPRRTARGRVRPARRLVRAATGSTSRAAPGSPSTSRSTSTSARSRSSCCTSASPPPDAASTLEAVGGAAGAKLGPFALAVDRMGTIARAHLRGGRQPRPRRPRLRLQAAARASAWPSMPASSRAAATCSRPRQGRVRRASWSCSFGPVVDQGDRRSSPPSSPAGGRAGRCCCWSSASSPPSSSASGSPSTASAASSACSTASPSRPLQSGLRTGVLDSVLFPPRPGRQRPAP